MIGEGLFVLAPKPVEIPPEASVDYYIATLHAAHKATDEYNDTIIPNIKSAVKSAQQASDSFNDAIRDYTCEVPVVEPQTKRFGIF